MAKTGPKPRPIADRFWNYVPHRPALECWEWSGKTTKLGYGVLMVGSRTTGRRYEFAHRLSLSLAGRDPAGMFACHRCDNPRCVNPDHLFLGTQKDNMSDAKQKGRVRKPVLTHCWRGHPYDGDNLRIIKGHRVCVECSRISRRAHYWRTKAQRSAS